MFLARSDQVVIKRVSVKDSCTEIMSEILYPACFSMQLVVSSLQSNPSDPPTAASRSAPVCAKAIRQSLRRPSGQECHQFSQTDVNPRLQSTGSNASLMLMPPFYDLGHSCIYLVSTSHFLMSFIAWGSDYFLLFGQLSFDSAVSHIPRVGVLHYVRVLIIVWFRRDLVRWFSNP